MRTFNEICEELNSVNISKFDVSQTMERVNKEIEGYGVECISIEGEENYSSYWGNVVAEYINMGDTYVETIIYSVQEGRFLVSCWGDFYQRLQVA